MQWQVSPNPTSQELPPGAYQPQARWRYSVFVTPDHSDAPRVVFFHDSFLLAPDERMSRTAPAPGALPPPASLLRVRTLLAEQFSRSAFTWQYDFDPALVERERPDVVVEECVERQLHYGPSGAAPPVAPH